MCLLIRHDNNIVNMVQRFSVQNISHFTNFFYLYKIESEKKCEEG